jgi:septum formation protein
MQLILSSSSPARKKLLQRLQLDFATATPAIDETPQPRESVTALVRRLAEAKARKVAPAFPEALVIGSDQVVELKGHMFGKPQSREAAFEQLQQMSGQAVNFITGLCLLNTATDQIQLVVEPFTVIFRQLKDETIENYLDLEQPYECAGSFKSEGLGIALCERFIGRDPTALEGLPLIQLANLLAQENMALL